MHSHRKFCTPEYYERLIECDVQYGPAQRTIPFRFDNHLTDAELEEIHQPKIDRLSVYQPRAHKLCKKDIGREIIKIKPSLLYKYRIITDYSFIGSIYTLDSIVFEEEYIRSIVVSDKYGKHNISTHDIKAEQSYFENWATV